MRSNGSSNDSKRSQIFLVTIFCMYSCYVMTDYFQKAQTFSTSYQYSQKAIPKYSTSHIHLPSLDELRFDKSKVMNNLDFDDVLMFDDYYSFTTEELEEEEQQQEERDDDKSDDISTTSLQDSNSTVSKNETSIKTTPDLNSTTLTNLPPIPQNLTNITNVTSDGG